MMENLPFRELNSVIHAPIRLTLMSALSGVDSADFPSLREILDVSDSVLSKHLALLESAGYVELVKGKAGRRPRTWVSLTEVGHDALEEYLAALHAVVDQASQTRLTSKMEA